jgi:uncharacterized phage-associated protein
VIDEVVKIKPENYVFEKDAVNLARLIINESNDLGIPINNPRLQRLLYLTQSAYLLESKGREGAFDDGLIQAWAFGPVVPEVYSKFVLFGEANISKIENLLIHLPNRELTFRKQKGSDTYFAIERASDLLTVYVPWVNPFTEIDKKIVDKVIYMFEDFTYYSLAEMSRKQDPWKNAWSKGSSTAIPNRSIYKYFRGLLDGKSNLTKN